MTTPKITPMGESAKSRLSSKDRREQLTRAAMQELAAHGYAQLTLEGIALRAGVTRNLLYHYFPRRKEDAFLAALRMAADEINGSWTTDDRIPLEERLATNFGTFVEQATTPSLAWQCLRQARGSSVPEAVAVCDGVYDEVVIAMSLNHFGTATPSPLQASALRAYAVFAEELLERTRTEQLDLDTTAAVLRQSLLGVVKSVHAAVVDYL